MTHFVKKLELIEVKKGKGKKLALGYVNVIGNRYQTDANKNIVFTKAHKKNSTWEQLEKLILEKGYSAMSEQDKQIRSAKVTMKNSTGTYNLGLETKEVTDITVFVDDNKFKLTGMTLARNNYTQAELDIAEKVAEDMMFAFNLMMQEQQKTFKEEMEKPSKEEESNQITNQVA